LLVLAEETGVPHWFGLSYMMLGAGIASHFHQLQEGGGNGERNWAFLG